jgi:glycosyltransferase involved in cell wall biosynthesis
MVSLSVVMPSLNSRRYIGDAIKSVLSQSFRDLELVIQDGGSTDGTDDLVLSLADPRISWSSETDDGQADALNRAIRRSRGDWILWLNADDRLEFGALERFAPILSAREESLVHGDFGIVDSEGRIVKRYHCSPMTFDRLLARGGYVFSGAVFVRRTLTSEVGPFDEQLHFCMDYDWLLRLARVSDVRYQPGIVAFLRDHAESKSRRQPWGFWREHWIVKRRHGAALPAASASQVLMAAHFIVRPLLRSTAWRRLRPVKRLGGPPVSTSANRARR